MIISNKHLSVNVVNEKTFYKYILQSNFHKSHITKWIFIFVKIADRESYIKKSEN